MVAPGREGIFRFSDLNCLPCESVIKMNFTFEELKKDNACHIKSTGIKTVCELSAEEKLWLLR